MRLGIIAAQLVLMFMTTIPAMAQPNLPVTEGQPETTKEALRRYNIATTEPALIEALQNQDLKIRQLAAQALAEDKRTNAIPAMERALVAETNEGSRVNVAFFLAQLGDPTGREYLKRTCDNNGEPAYIRMLAAINMRYLQMNPAPTRWSRFSIRVPLTTPERECKLCR